MIAFNFNGQGLSAENATADAVASGAKRHVVINESKLAAALMAAGLQPVYRMKGDGALDDDYAYLKHDPAAFVNTLNALAPAGAALYLGNEMGSDNLLTQADWTRRAITRCQTFGRKPVIFNTSVGHPTQGQSAWRIWKPAVLDAVAAGGRVGVHIYYDVQPSRSAFAFRVLDDLWTVCGAGTPVSVTEYGCAVNMDAYRGWATAGYPDEAAYASAQIDGVQTTLTRNPRADIDWQTFIYGAWSPTASFNVQDATEYKRAIATWNRTTRMPPVPMPVPPLTWTPAFIKPTGSFAVNIRKEPNTSSPVIGSIPATGVSGAYKGYSADWHAIQVQSITGYVNAAVVALNAGGAGSGVFIQLPEVLATPAEREGAAQIFDALAKALRA